MVVRNILITGANGFIGTHLHTALHNAGHTVIAAVRTSSSLTPNTIETGDLASFNSWEQALHNIDTVIHLAGRAHQTDKHAANNDAAFQQANVVTTQRLLHACKQHHVKRFIFLSTIAVAGYDSGDTPFSSTTYAPFNPYSRSKAEAEACVQASSLDYSIVRIPLVYGAGVRANFLSLMNMVDKGISLPLGMVNNRRSLLYVGNLVDALQHIIPSEATYGKHLNIADTAPLSSPALIRHIANALDRSPRLLPIPSLCMKLGARLIDKPMLYHKLCGNLEMETQTTQQLLNWQPPFSTQDGLRETVRWFHAQK